MKQLLIDAMKFLSDQRERAASAGNGLTTFEDPRSADWLRSYTACRLAGFYLPGGHLYGYGACGRIRRRNSGLRLGGSPSSWGAHRFRQPR